ncbi:hypothetical protein EVA_18064 [gut metagenome]|uniref:Uncharacterized protein n=1 Tax=gut metagenome TaxID=749906 RepID=J9G2M7_9ZZZZ
MQDSLLHRAFLPDDRTFHEEPQPNGKWSLQELLRRNPYHGSTQQW